MYDDVIFIDVINNLKSRKRLDGDNVSENDKNPYLRQAHLQVLKKFENQAMICFRSETESRKRRTGFYSWLQ